MIEKVNLIKKEFEQTSTSINDLKTLNDIRVEYLGKQGKVTELSKLMKDVPNEQKKEFGMLVNEVMVFETWFGKTGYYVCPRCKITMDREFMSFCDRCGQKLDWRYYRKAKIVYPGQCRK